MVTVLASASMLCVACVYKPYSGSDPVVDEAVDAGLEASGDAAATDGAGNTGDAFTPSTDAATAVLIGSATVPLFQDQGAPGTAEAFLYTATASGTVTALHIHTYKSGGNVSLGVYSNNGGTPGTVLASTVVFAPTASTWTSGQVAAFHVVAGQSYWIALHAQASTVYFESTIAGGTSSIDSNGSPVLPATWTSNSTGANSPAALYASGVLQ